MALLNDLWSDIRAAAKLKATIFVIHKVDVEKIADYVLDYAEKNYPNGKKVFIEMIYMRLLELVSAVNRRRK